MQVRFGDVRIVMQSKPLAALDEYGQKEEAIYQRIRGNIRVMGYDREVDAVVKQELGERPVWDSAKTQAIEARFQAHLDSLAQANQGNPDYRVLMLMKGNLPNPADPARKSYQKLVIDGEDVPKFMKEVYEKAFFQKPVYQNSRLSGTAVNPIHHSTESYPGRGMENAFSQVMNRYYQATIEAYQKGQTDKILDLDA